MTDTLPELPDEDGDFTPNLARAIMEKYRELLAGRDAEIERLTRELYLEKNRADNLSDNWEEANSRALAAGSSLSEAVKAEREACAKVAENLIFPVLPDQMTTREFLKLQREQTASAIRSRAAVLDSERGSTHEA